eukprot:TRINITY_DN4535_c0_g1::TRINITY_DN4535_c0_g1_i1::g.23218::m.23218 TRINITY_DN4535_c0_g1::TRINITY_DN4535_c0_g1_i1::g.23218  ORF type:complete len:333 (+),score=46.26,sp/Q5NL76/RL25_ZYMMO/34.88/6e-11,Ribosomal_TL5_C/PF14693.1/4e-14 TRINITY_DN4535_c0_g1_i1:64-1062(+)
MSGLSGYLCEKVLTQQPTFQRQGGKVTWNYLKYMLTEANQPTKPPEPEVTYQEAIRARFQIQTASKATPFAVTLRSISKPSEIKDSLQQGLIPAEITSKNNRVRVQIPRPVLQNNLPQFVWGNTLYNVLVYPETVAPNLLGGKLIAEKPTHEFLTIVNEAERQVDDYRKIIYANFLHITPNEPFQMKIPIRFVNQYSAPGIRMGGELYQLIDYVTVKVNSLATMPKVLDVDLAGMEVGDSITARNIEVPDGVELISPTMEMDKSQCAIARVNMTRRAKLELIKQGKLDPREADRRLGGAGDELARLEKQMAAKQGKGAADAKAKKPEPAKKK